MTDPIKCPADMSCFTPVKDYPTVDTPRSESQDVEYDLGNRSFDESAFRIEPSFTPYLAAFTGEVLKKMVKYYGSILPAELDENPYVEDIEDCVDGFHCDEGPLDDYVDEGPIGRGDNAEDFFMYGHAVHCFDPCGHEDGYEASSLTLGTGILNREPGSDEVNWNYLAFSNLSF